MLGHSSALKALSAIFSAVEPDAELSVGCELSEEDELCEPPELDDDITELCELLCEASDELSVLFLHPPRVNIAAAQITATNIFLILLLLSFLSEVLFVVLIIIYVFIIFEICTKKQPHTAAVWI